MKALLTVLTPVALLDSLSMLPFGVAALATLMTGRRPLLGAGAFISGIAITYTGFGLLAFFGLSNAFAAMNAAFEKFLHDPDTIDYALQVVIGAVMLIFGFRLTAARRARQEAKSRKASPGMGPGGAFGLGFFLVVTGIPGALPYFAAIDQMLRADLSPVPTFLALLFYNGMFVLPLLVFLVMQQLFPAAAARMLAAVTAFMGTWGRRIGAAVLLILGLVLVADGVAALAGHPLIKL